MEVVENLEPKAQYIFGHYISPGCHQHQEHELVVLSDAKVTNAKVSSPVGTGLDSACENSTRVDDFKLTWKILQTTGSRIFRDQPW